MSTQFCKACKHTLNIDCFFNKDNGIISATRCYACALRQRKHCKTYRKKLKNRAQKASNIVETLGEIRSENSEMIELFKKLILTNSTLPTGKQLTIPTTLQSKVDEFVKK